MNAEYFYGATRKNAAKGTTRPAQPHDLHGKPVTGRIASIQIGQGHGYIRLPDERAVYFHRADLGTGTALYDLKVGDRVVFELLEDKVSGARALRVVRQKRAR